MTSNNSKLKSIVGLYDNHIILRNTITNDRIELKMKLDGEIISNLKIIGSLDILHNIGNNLQNTKWKDGLNYLVNQNLPFKYHIQYTFIHSLEKLIGISSVVPKRANYLRTIILEFERIISNIKFTQRLIKQASFPLLYTTLNLLKDKIQLIIDQDFLIEPKKQFIVLGGVEDSFTEKTTRIIYFKLLKCKEDFQKIAMKIRKNRILKEVLQDNGFIPREEAKKLALTGPLARSSGISIDIRKSDPYAAYNDTIFSIPVYDTCDLYGELMVRQDEIIESFNIILQLLDETPDGESMQILPNNNVIAGNVTTRVETPEGELFSFIMSKSGTLDDTPNLFKLHSPIKINQKGMEKRITEEAIENLSYLIASIGTEWISLG